MQSTNNQPVRVDLNRVLKLNISNDDTQRALKIINSSLDAISPSKLMTAREVSYEEIELTKFGLEIAKLVFQLLNSGSVAHNDVVGSSESKQGRTE